MNQSKNTNNESFEELFKESISQINSFESNIVKGVIIHLDQYYATVDVGLKSEGKISLNEFKNAEGESPNFKLGDEVEVFIERYEDKHGNIVLSRDRAKKEEVWYELEKKMVDNTPVNGLVIKRVKGGFAVNIEGTLAFLPGSQLDARSIKNINALVGTTQLLQILKMDKQRFNIIVSKKSLAGKTINEDGEIVAQETYKEGQIVEGVVKNITGYGAFIDLGSVDGLLHVTDISWSRINHISEVLTLGQTLKLKVTKINPDNNRISLGLKQLQEDPWVEVAKKYKVGDLFTLKISNTADYGVFVNLAPGIEGLIHISELSWTKKDINPKNEYTVGDDITVKVIEIDEKKRKTNLSVKQCINNPWADFIAKNPEGTILTVEVKGTNDHGLVVALNNELNSLIKTGDISWESRDKSLLSSYKVGDKVEVKIIKTELEKDRVVLSIKHLTEDKSAAVFDDYKKGTVVNGKVISHIDGNDLEVEIKEGVVGIVKRNDIAVEKEEQKADNYPIGSEIEAVVNGNQNGKLNLSIKAHELAKRKKYLSSGEEGSFSALADAMADAVSKKENK
jgi:small subunit ribosomal protein S1